MTTAERCENPKVHFRTEESAQAALERILRDPDPWRDHHPRRVIGCDWCKGWVLTHNKGKAEDKPLATFKPVQRGRRRWSGNRQRRKG